MGGGRGEGEGGRVEGGESGGGRGEGGGGEEESELLSLAADLGKTISGGQLRKNTRDHCPLVGEEITLLGPLHRKKLCPVASQSTD